MVMLTLTNWRNYKVAKDGKTPKSKMTDTERGTLLEDIARDVKRIAEAQGATADKISKIEKVVERVPAIESELKAVSMAVITLSGEVKSLTGDVKEIKTDMKSLKNKIEEALANHGKHITKLEEKVLV